MGAPEPELEESLLSALAERRLALRIPVSLTVGVTDGLRRRAGELLDLSLTGARLRFTEPVTADRRPWLWVPAGLGGRLPHPVFAEVAWTESIEGSPTGHCQVGLRFRAYPFGAQRRLARALGALLARVNEQARSCELPALPERRESPRIHYDRRVIARGAGTPLVLLGRDLSSGGLRVETRRALATGDRLQLALHAGGDVPLVVQAEVVRAIADSIWALAFRDVGAAQQARIDAIVREQASPRGEACSLLVSEVAASPEA
jgi:hypothetical protein